MSDYAKLRELCEKALSHQIVNELVCSEAHGIRLAYIAAASPDVVLWLLGELDRLRECIARMESNASIPHRVKAIAREALKGTE